MTKPVKLMTSIPKVCKIGHNTTEDYKEYSLSDFLDIEDAFSKVKTNSISRAINRMKWAVALSREPLKEDHLLSSVASHSQRAISRFWKNNDFRY